MSRLLMLLLTATLAMTAADSAIAAPMSMSSMSAPIMLTQQAGPYKIALALLPAEPFITQAQYKMMRPTEGMLVVGGAAPVQPGSASHPNHHLVAHVYRHNGMAVQGAHVTMTIRKSGMPPITVPIVEMQAAGKGAQSTHYGNNVRLAPGNYRVAVAVGPSASTTFSIHVK